MAGEDREYQIYSELADMNGTLTRIAVALERSIEQNAEFLKLRKADEERALRREAREQEDRRRNDARAMADLRTVLGLMAGDIPPTDPRP